MRVAMAFIILDSSLTMYQLGVRVAKAYGLGRDYKNWVKPV